MGFEGLEEVENQRQNEGILFFFSRLPDESW